jgi:DNA-binding GntR family transcriptional regulator
MKKNSHSTKINIERLSDKAYEAIKGRIIDLSLEPGEKLLEQQLAADLGVSKSPIRDAFQRLEREKLVLMIPFKGWYVQPVSLEEFKEIHQVREALEIYCLQGHLGAYGETDINVFKKTMALARKRLEQGSNSGAYDAHRSFHKLIVDLMKNRLIGDMYGNISDRLDRYLSISVKYVPDRVKTANREHFALLEAIEKKDVALAIQRLRDHLSGVMEDYLKSDEIKRFTAPRLPADQTAEAAKDQRR